MATSLEIVNNVELQINFQKKNKEKDNPVKPITEEKPDKLNVIIVMDLDISLKIAHRKVSTFFIQLIKEDLMVKNNNAIIVTVLDTLLETAQNVYLIVIIQLENVKEKQSLYATIAT